MTSFSHRATATASTKRPPAISSGKRGLPSSNLSSFAITPLVPISAATQQRLVLGSPMELQEAFTDGDRDIEKGDVLVTPASTGREYPIRFVEKFSFGKGVRMQIIIEKVGG